MKDEDMQMFMRETVKIIQHMGNDIVKLQMMFYNLLDDIGKIERAVCPSCNEEVLRPLLPNIPLEEVCPACGESLFDKNQMSIDDWDSGITREEE